jgi:ubiquinone/menaquinone biosynthesis C-methylase UbiE
MPTKPYIPSTISNYFIIIMEIQEFFDCLAIDRDMNLERDPILAYEQKMRAKAVLSYLKPSVNETILEIGCGNGRDLVLIAKSCKNIAGIDYSPEMVAQAAKKILHYSIENATVAYGNATDLKFDDASFDKVLCSEVVEHIPDWEQAIKEISRVLKPGGKLVLSTPNNRSFYGIDRYVWERVLKKEWYHPFDKWKNYINIKTVVDKNDFTILSVKGACYLPGFIIAYRLKKPLKQILVKCTSFLEPFLCRLFPRNAYMIVLHIIKNIPSTPK